MLKKLHKSPLVCNMMNMMYKKVFSMVVKFEKEDE